jgi:hypothetical protein
MSARPRGRLVQLARMLRPPALPAAAEPAPLSAEEKEAALRAEAASWVGVTSDPSQLAFASPAEIPTIDLGPYHAAGCGPGPELEAAASQLRAACETIGFHYITVRIRSGVGGAPPLADTYHSLPLADKLSHEMDVPAPPKNITTIIKHSRL